jgi:4'-phosphopantetheinyl transferase
VTDSTCHPAALRTPAVVSVWWADLDQPEEVIASLDNLCTEHEHRRSRRLPGQLQARRWLTGRGILRSVLMRRLPELRPHFPFLTARFGKPYLSGESTLRFSVSHSDHRLVVALCESAEVGVDLQFQDQSTDIEAIARCFFTSREREILSRTSLREKRSMFFRIWVLKEAWLKAQGTGLRVPLSVAEVACAFDITPPNGHIECFTAPGSTCTLSELSAPPSFAAAVACEQHKPVVCTRPWLPAACHGTFGRHSV